MTTLQKDNKFQALLFALFAFFILVFFTTNIYSELQWSLDENNTKQEELNKLNTKLEELNLLKNNLQDSSLDETKKIKKFVWEFSEDKILLYINEYIEQINMADQGIVLFLDDISFSEPKKSELGFNEIDIDLKMQISDKNYLNNMLDYLTSNNNKYSFFITDFSFEIEKSGPYTVNIPLKMYVNK